MLLWATVPWIWMHPNALWWVQPVAWPTIVVEGRRRVASWTSRWRSEPEVTAAAARREVRERVRSFLGFST